MLGQPKLLEVGDSVWLSGGYDMEPKWLGGDSGDLAKIVDFWPGQNRNGALLVELEKLLRFDGIEGKHLILELRYKGAQWLNTEVVHLELLQSVPEKKRWQDRQQGKWIESHATYKKLDR